jgi:hypothetical protein
VRKGKKSRSLWNFAYVMLFFYKDITKKRLYIGNRFSRQYT